MESYADDNHSVSRSKISALTADSADRHEGSFRFIELPSFSDTDADVDEEFISSRDFGRRQAYLRSYTFTRAEAEDLAMAPAAAAEEENPEATNSKSRVSLLRLKVAAWAVMACHGKYRLPVGLRAAMERVAVRVTAFVSEGAGWLSASRVHVPQVLDGWGMNCGIPSLAIARFPVDH